jgi:hypothetical protein
MDLHDIAAIANNFDLVLLLDFFSWSKMLDVKNGNTALLFLNNKKLGKLFCFIGNGSVVEEASIVHKLFC